jgi:hypothetical protein
MQGQRLSSAPRRCPPHSTTLIKCMYAHAESGCLMPGHPVARQDFLRRVFSVPSHHQKYQFNADSLSSRVLCVPCFVSWMKVVLDSRCARYPELRSAVFRRDFGWRNPSSILAKLFAQNHPVSVTDRAMSPVYFLRNEQPSVSLALPPVGWQSTVEQPAQITTVWAWEKTVVMVKQPGHLTSMKNDRGAGTSVYIECQIFFEAIGVCGRDPRTLSLCLRASA